MKICLNCNKNIKKELKICKCGHTKFIYGVITDTKYKCTSCNGEEFIRTAHISTKNKTIDEYLCKNKGCKNKIKIEIFK